MQTLGRWPHIDGQTKHQSLRSPLDTCCKSPAHPPPDRYPLDREDTPPCWRNYQLDTSLERDRDRETKRWREKEKIRVCERE